MVFSSFTFLWLFFPAVFVLYRITPKKNVIFRNCLLLLASLFFYAWGGVRSILLLCVCILVDYGMGFLIGSTEAEASAPPERKKRLFLALAILFNLGILCYYKYFDFAKSLLNQAVHTVFPVGNILAPIGVSFFTFKSISYLVDVYRRKLPVQRNLISLGLYISFFPHIMSGPIAQYEEMAAQIDGVRELSTDRTAYGVKRFIYGLGKKVLIADILGAFVDKILSLEIQTVPGVWYWLVMVCYTLQIYYDFSGYSDMAIGLGEMFGFTVKENFRYPYLSRSLREFWRRWHMSLNRWFQNYLYIPLGGSRRGTARTLLNLMVVFFLTGLWHGAGLNFIAWGLWHGLFMLFERTAFGKWLDSPRARVFSRVYTLLVVALGWMMFRTDSMHSVMQIFASMFSFAQVPASMPLALYLRPLTLTALAAAVLFCGPIQQLVPGLEQNIWEREGISPVQTVWLVFIFALSMLLNITSTYSSFIYFKF